MTHMQLVVSNCDGGTHRRLSLPVDVGAKYLTLPRRLLTFLQIAPIRSETFRLGIGHPLVRDVGVAMVRYRDASAATQVIFGEPGDMCLLGLVTLEELGLELNPRSGRICRSSPGLLPFRSTPGS